MATISQLHIDVTLTADEASRMLKALRQQGNDTFGGMGEGAEGAKGKIIALNQALELGQKAMGALGMVIRAVGGIGRAMIEGNSVMERYETQMGVLLGGAEKAQSMMKDISDFAASTPFELPELADSARNLLSFGVAQEKILPTMKAIGDVSSGIGAPISEMAELFGKAKVQGTLFAEDINQLVGRGVPVIGEFAKQLGVTESEVKKLASEGKISFEMLEQAFVDLSSEGGKFAGMMEAQSQTFEGLMSTLKDNVAQLLREVGGPLFAAVKNIVDKLIKLLGSAEMQALIEKIGAAIAKVVEGVMPVAEALIPVMGALMEVVAQLLPPLADLVAVLVEALKPIFAVIIDLVVQLAPVLGTLIGVVARVVRAFAPVLAVFAEFLGELLVPLIPLIVTLADLLVSLVPLYELLYPAIAAIIQVGTQMIAAVVTPLIDGIRWIIENAKAAIDAVTSIFSSGDDDKKPRATGEQAAAAAAAAEGGAPAVDPAAPPASGAGAKGGTQSKRRTLKDVVSEMIEMNKLLIDDGQRTNDAFLRQLEERLASVTGNSREELEVRKTLRAEIKAIGDKMLEEEKKRIEEQKKLEKELSDAIKAAFKLRDEIREMDMGEEELALHKERLGYEERIRQLEEFHAEHLYSDAEYQQLRETLEFQHQERLWQIEREYLGKSKDAESERLKARQESMRRERDLTVSQAQEMMTNLSEIAGENFQAQKAISIAQAVISTYAGATKALEQGGVLGIPLMATVILAGLAQVAKIATTNPARRRTGGLVPGGPQYVMMNEAGEEYVINAEATRRNLPVLEAINAGMSIAEATGYSPVQPSSSRGRSPQSVTLAGEFVFSDGALRAAIEHDLVLDEQGTL